MKATRLVTMATISVAVLLAADRPDFSGRWQAEGANAAGAEVLTITQSEGEVRISGSPGQKAATDIRCATSGKECDATIGGERAKVSYWFNGPMLVEMATVGKNKDRVIKTRRSLSEDGRRMEVEIITIVPAGKGPEKVVFVREQSVAASDGAAKARP